MLSIFRQKLLNSSYYEILSNFHVDYSFKSFTDYPLGIAIASIIVIATAAAAVTLFGQRKQKGCLDPKKFKEFKLVKRTRVSHNSDKFRFALPTPQSVLGLPVGQYIRCRGKDSQGQEIVKPYTPITLDSTKGYFDILVKMYPQGRMSHHFRHMREGDFLPVTGPVGRFKYKPGQARAFGMLAGGTGITPMFQLTRAILENPKDQTKINLIYANHTVDDILLKDELDRFANVYPEQFKVYYVVSQPPRNWDSGVGHISKEVIQEHCPRPASDVMILRCGPPGMNKAMASHLNELGYTPKMQFEF